jgi:hypothetical protein
MTKVDKLMKMNSLTCLICNKTFVTKEVFAAHNMVIHDISSGPSDIDADWLNIYIVTSKLSINQINNS